MEAQSSEITKMADVSGSVVVDLRNIYRTADMEAHGFTYESVGRAPEPAV